MRKDLLVLMSAYSEETWCAGWLIGLDRILHGKGGLWEIMGRYIGWPIGYNAQHGWMEWDEARAYYQANPKSD